MFETNRKTVTFLRHYKLAYPFDHWTNMALEQFASLGNGTVDPEIDLDTVENYVKENIKGSWDVIISSPSKRTLQSAEYFERYFKIQEEIIIFDDAKESPWVLDPPITDPEFESMKEEKILKVHTKRIEGIQDRINRAERILQFISKLKEGNILVIMHSHMIAVINCIISNPHLDKTNVTEEDIKKFEIGGYLKGITMQLS